MNILSVLLLSISSNLDNIIFGITYGVANVKIAIKYVITISAITTIITGSFMLLGLALGELFNVQIANIIGGVLLVLIGIYLIVAELFQIENSKASESISIKNILVIAMSLSINNIPIAIAGGISNTNVFYTVLFSFIFSSLFMYLGNTVGRKFKGTIVSIVASLLLIILGIIKCL